MATFAKVSALLLLSGLCMALPTSEAADNPSHPLIKRAPQCYEYLGYSPCSTAQAEYIANYLNGNGNVAGEGTQPCTVSSQGTLLIDYQNCRAYGTAQNGVSASSNCEDVGGAIDDIISSCTYASGSVSGASYAHGNGNLFIQLYSA